MNLINLLFFFFIIIPSAVIHEYAHGLSAELLGDPTAKYAGRLTLNPMAHIDLMGTIAIPILLFLASGGTFIFAYAKPVPFNPYNLKNQRYGPALVALAGPGANLVVAVIFGIMIRLLALSNFTLPAAETGFTYMLSIIVYANILLAIFNLVPIPPLDGSKILFSFLPSKWDNLKLFLEQYGFFLLLFFIFFAFDLIRPVIQLLFQLMVGSRNLLF